MSSVCRPRSIAFLLALGLTVVPAAATAQQVYLRAVDPLGAPVLDLRADEVRVREDGVERRVRDVRLANLPVHLTVLVDNSWGGRATRGVGVQRLLHYRAALTSLVDRLPPNQLVSILPLAGEPRWLLRPSIDRDEIRGRIADLTPGRDWHAPARRSRRGRSHETEESNEPARPGGRHRHGGGPRAESGDTQERYQRGWWTGCSGRASRSMPWW